MFEKLLKFLEGKKTILCSIGLFLVIGAEGMGWIPKEVAEWLKGALVAGAGISLHSAISRAK